MAQRTVVVRTDDFDGKELGPGEGQTISLAVDGVEYEIDLSDRNAQKLREDLGKWVDKARRVDGTRRRGRTSSSKATRDYEPKDVRKWAKSNNVEVPARGRIPAEVIDQYKAVGN
jgi:hypothetical protein